MFNSRLDDALEYDWDMELAPQIVETVGTGVAPDHTEDFDALVTLEARIDDLVHLRESILNAGGMNQQFALEAQRLLPEFDGQRPLGFYTQLPTATRYKVALEEMSGGIWALIAAGIAAIIYALVKFFKWMKGERPDEDSGQTIEHRLSQLKEVQVLLRQCDKLVSDGVASTHGQYMYLKDKPQEEVFSLDKVIRELFMGSPHDQKIAAFLQTKDPFFHDLVHKGPYSTELATLGVFFKDLQVIMRQRLATLEAVAKADLHDESATALMANKRALDLLHDPISVKFHDHESSLADIRVHLSTLHGEVANAQVEGSLSFDQLFSTMSDAFDRSDVVASLEALQHTLPLLEKLKEELVVLEKKTGDYTKDGKAGEHSTFVGQQLRHSVFVLGQDVASLVTLTGELMGYQSRLLYLASSAASFATMVAVRLGTHGRNQNGGELSKWRAVGEELKEVDKKFKKAVA